MAFSPRLGCPMCSIVSTASHVPSATPLTPQFPSGSTAPEVLWKDENFSVYREKANPVSSQGHIIIAFNLHVPSLYTLSSADVPLLVSIKSLATRLLMHTSTRASGSSLSNLTIPTNKPDTSQFRIGFITPPFKDNKIPITDHLHAHAYVAPADRMGWWRGVAYGPLAWYAIDDLIAEIRESTSNNRIKTGHQRERPIDKVPNAGARAGAANGRETADLGLGTDYASNLEAADGPTTPTSIPRTLSPAFTP